MPTCTCTVFRPNHIRSQVFPSFSLSLFLSFSLSPFHSFSRTLFLCHVYPTKCSSHLSTPPFVQKSSPSPSPPHPPAEHEYHKLANVLVDDITDALEVAEEAREDMEVESSGDGVVTAKVRQRCPPTVPLPRVAAHVSDLPTSTAPPSLPHSFPRLPPIPSLASLGQQIKDKGTWVINKQAPSRQIWLSSPLRCEPSCFHNLFSQRQPLPPACAHVHKPCR